MLEKKIADMDELDRKISGMVRALDGPAIETAVASAGSVILKEVENRAPVRTGQLKASIKNYGYHKKGRAGSTISVANSKKYGIRHYAVFIEYGTAKMAAKAFMRPAFDASQKQALDAFTKSLTAELEKL